MRLKSELYVKEQNDIINQIIDVKNNIKMLMV